MNSNHVKAKVSLGRRVLLVCLLVWIFTIFAGDHTMPSRITAERRSLAILTTMVESGDWLLPRYEGNIHLTKPPLLYWLGLVPASLTHSPELWNLRIISGVFALLGSAFLLLLGERLFASRRAGYLAALLMLSSWGSLEHMHSGLFDMPMATCVIISVWAAIVWLEGRATRHFLILILALSAAFMFKGPVAWGLAALPVTVWLLQRRGNGAPTISRSQIVLLVAGTLGLSLAWYVWVIATVPIARQIFLDCLLVSFGRRSEVADMAFHRAPFYYYLPKLAVYLLPWLLFLLPLLPRLWRERRALLRRPELVPLAWLVLGTVLLSLVPAKSGRYLVPVIPAWFLFAGYQLDRYVDGTLLPREMAGFRQAMRLLGWLVAVGGLGLTWWLWFRIGVPLNLCVAIIAVMVAGGWLVQRLAVQEQRLDAILALVALMGLIYLPFFQTWMPMHLRLRAKEQPTYSQFQKRQNQVRTWFGMSPVKPYTKPKPSVEKKAENTQNGDAL